MQRRRASLSGQKIVGHAVDAAHAAKLGLAVAGYEFRRIRCPGGRRIEAVAGVIHIQIGIGLEGIALVNRRRVDNLIDDQALAHMGRHVNYGIAGNQIGLFQ
ncbi:MAG: hypothetical protein VCE75_19885 [Alphaproteobacteria bacterium]